MTGSALPARLREASRVVRSAGVKGLARRVVRVAYKRMGAAQLDGQIDLDLIADSRGLSLAGPAQRPTRGTPLTIGWLCSPPGRGSGGHTTFFRMVEAAEKAGHTCVLYLYDPFGGEVARHEAVIRQFWPWMRAEVRSVANGLSPMDAYVASAWETAHVLAAHASLPTRRLYFIQDFEPYFYPQGAHYVLAEDTYRFGFRAITVGPMLADLLLERYGVTAAVAEFGCDTSTYRLTNPDRRRGVVFYARRETPRRGFELGVLALREFHRRHPEHEIHLFGDPNPVDVPFPVTDHGVLTPSGLCELYNRCAAGLALSFTNLSLVPDEMLACGVVPVVGESTLASVSIDNPFLTWVPPTPLALADGLSNAIQSGPSPSEVAASVRATPWSVAQSTTVATIEDEVYG